MGISGVWLPQSILATHRSQSEMLAGSGHIRLCSIQTLSMFALDQGGNREMPFSVNRNPKAGMWNCYD